MNEVENFSLLRFESFGVMNLLQLTLPRLMHVSFKSIFSKTLIIECLLSTGWFREGIEPLAKPFPLISNWDVFWILKQSIINCKILQGYLGIEDCLWVYLKFDFRGVNAVVSLDWIEFWCEIPNKNGEFIFPPEHFLFVNSLVLITILLFIVRSKIDY